MKQLLNKNRLFIFPYLILMVLTGIILIIFSKSEIHIFINHFHSFIADKFFVFITIFGSGIFAILLSLSMLFVKYRLSLFIFLSYAISGIIVQILKNMVFPHDFRPYEYFKDIQGIYYVPGIDNNVFQSFPSGHSATAFSIFFCLSLVISQQGRKFYSLIFFLIASIIAFSRVYLSQHFLIDIYFGSMIGFISTLLFARIVLLSNKIWLDKSLLSHTKANRK